MTEKPFSFLLLLVLSLIWGSSFILMKLGMYGPEGQSIFSAIDVASWRMLIASSLFLPFSITLWKQINSWKTLLYLLIVGMCGSFIPAFLFTTAETSIHSAMAGMLNSFTPIFTIVLGFFIFKQSIKRNQVIGVFVGTTGLISLALIGDIEHLKGDILPVSMVVMATFCYALSLSVIKYKLQELHPLTITTLSLSLIWLPSLLIVISGKSFEVFEHNGLAAKAFGFVFILSFFGTVTATLLFNYLIKLSSALFASSVTYLMPIVALLIGLFFGEEILWFQVISMAIILIGILIANQKPSKKA